MNLCICSCINNRASTFNFVGRFPVGRLVSDRCRCIASTSFRSAPLVLSASYATLFSDFHSLLIRVEIEAGTVNNSVLDDGYIPP